MAGPTILDEAKVELCYDRVNGNVFAVANIAVHLIEAGTTFDHTDTRATLIALAPTFSGYGGAAVATWGAPVLDAAFKAISIGTVVTFTNTGGSPSGSITHWWYEDQANNKAILVGEFATPIIIPPYQSYSFTPTFSVTGENLTT